VRLLSLSVRDFRNLACVEIEPAPRATVFVGRNGQGKTNLLEAVYFLCALKPLRQARLGELVRFGAASAALAARVERVGGGGPRKLAVELTPAARTAYLDGKAQPRLDAYLEGLAAVCFTPDDLLLVKGGPEARRRFMDRAAFNRWPAVLTEARDYVTALRARNAALRSGSPAVEQSFRAPLVRAAARLVRRRREVLAELAPRVALAHGEIGGPDAPPVTLAYHLAGAVDPGGSEEAIAARIDEALAAREPRDRARGYTSIGPHMDDLVLELGGRAARAFGSQGQQRALVLALKIGEVENLRALLGRPPLILLDDVSSELDPEKNRFLFDYLGRMSGQALLTTTDRALLAGAVGPDTACFRVEAGAVARQIV